MKDIINLYKEVGETPLQRVERFRENNPEYCWEKLTYAGRLDPLAEGVLITLTGENSKERSGFLALPKEYEFEIMFGVSTDTYDILGRIIQKKDVKKEGVSKLPEVLDEFKGKRMQKYPPFSSKPVDGRPLFQWAKESKIGEINIPEKEIEIYEISLMGEGSIESSKVIQKIEKAFSTLDGDFRQDEILKSWREQAGERKFLSFRVKVKCSSGTYVRGIAHDVSERLGVPACVFSIKRNKVGDYTIENSIR